MTKIPFGFQIIGVRSKCRFALLVFVSNEMFFIFLSIYISQVFIILALIVLIVCGFYIITLKCPVCGKPVLYNPVNNLGIKMHAYTVTIPENCTQCGMQLD